jgi:hypothetical protein
MKFYSGFFTDEVIYSLESDPELLSRWLQMFVPVRSAAQFIEMVRRPLYQAPTYHVASDIVGVVNDIYLRTISKTAHLSPGDLPTETGFAWLDTPLVLRDAGGYSVATRALSWGPQYITEDYLEGTWPPAGSQVGREGVRLTSWGHVDDSDATTVPEMADRLRTWHMPLSVSHSAFVPFDTPLQVRDPAADDLTGDDITRWSHTLWMFLETEIVRVAREQAERPARRRAERLIGGSDLRVVTLRRARTEGAEPGHRDVDWSCRWIVQAHYRHLDEYRVLHHVAKVSRADKEHCVTCGERVARIRAYVKGHDGLPLKAVPETVYRVAR